jgi:hypothetical protein
MKREAASICRNATRLLSVVAVADAWRCGFGRITHVGKAIEAA